MLANVVKEETAHQVIWINWHELLFMCNTIHILLHDIIIQIWFFFYLFTQNVLTKTIAFHKC